MVLDAANRVGLAFLVAVMGLGLITLL